MAENCRDVDPSPPLPSLYEILSLTMQSRQFSKIYSCFNAKSFQYTTPNYHSINRDNTGTCATCTNRQRTRQETADKSQDTG